jgi:hypothetical protein
MTLSYCPSTEFSELCRGWMSQGRHPRSCGTHFPITHGWLQWCHIKCPLDGVADHAYTGHEVLVVVLRKRQMALGIALRHRTLLADAPTIAHRCNLDDAASINEATRSHVLRQCGKSGTQTAKIDNSCSRSGLARASPSSTNRPRSIATKRSHTVSACATFCSTRRIARRACFNSLRMA